MFAIVLVVSEGEYRVLKLMAERGFSEGSLEEASRILGLDVSSLASYVMLLRERGLLEVYDVEREVYEVTERGEEALREGLPERRLVELLAFSSGVADMSRVAATLGRLAGVAVGKAREKGLVIVDRNVVKLAVSPEEAVESVEALERALAEVARGRYSEVRGELLEELSRRGLVKKSVETRRYIRLKRDPRLVLEEARVEVAKLTHDLVKTGAWRSCALKSYDVRAEPYSVLPARPHFLQEFIEMLRDVMVELGFREVRGPLVEVELFNFDLLFQAQDHPAREIHDSLWLDAEPLDVEEAYGRELVSRVARVHEEGWGYRWSKSIASRVMLRSQTTSVSVRVLALLKPKPPIRFFTLGRVFRHDAVDATHLPEFHQLDGIEGWHGYTFRDLLLTLKEVFERLGLEVKFKPAYFPFTEPSVEGYVKLPSGRWLELFGAGLFRPEVLEMAGVDYPVGAWGFGIERLAAAFYGLSDIRMLYTSDTGFVKSFPARWR
ncbi:MAG: phenylalanine--tRNA ligase subunit alpha [Acidilobaceae archaeon]